MDCLGSALGSFLAEAGRGLSRSTYTRAIYTIRFKSNVKALENALNSLVDVQEKVEKDLKTLEIKGKSLHVQLRRWLRDVEEIVSEANSIQEGPVSCALSLRCKRSKKLVVVLEKVKKLQKQGVELLDIFSFEGRSLVEKILGPSIADQTRASEILVKVLNCLLRDDVQKIEDYSIEIAELVRYWIAEGFIDETQNHGYLMNQGITLVENLKDSCLLEEGVHGDTVKMHDVVRDFAIWVMSSSRDDSHSLVMSGIGLCEFPHEKFVPSIRRVSLMNNKLKRLSDEVVECVELSALLLHGNFHLEELPVGFLISFPALRILNLSGTRIRQLPHSLSELHELRSLILRDCYYLEEVPSLEGLAKIQVLDLCATPIKETPRGLETLRSLRLLDLSRTHHLESIPAGIIPQLSSLEVLNMTLSHFHWGVQEQTQEGQATLEEIACLQRLSVLSVRVVCVPPLSPDYNSWIERLKKFQLFIGPTANSLPSRHDKRRVTISSLNVSEAFIGWLLANTTSLVMNHCWGLNEMLENLVIDSTSSFNMLRSLTVEGFGGSIRPAGGCVAQLDLIPNLEELHLRRVNLGTIRELVGHLGLRFETLKHLEVSRCSRLKCLLSLGNFICFLPNLQEIHVSFCEMLQELFDYSPGEVPTSASVVPGLRVIKLRNLPQLKRLCSQEESWGCLEHVEVIRCNFLKNLPISSNNAHRVRDVRGETHWWNNLTWDDDTTRETLQPRFIPSDGNILTGSLGVSCYQSSNTIEEASPLSD
ncbi:Leucine-rich repeat-containing protein [Hirschfeldia incana]|nr:Leucine-rich repeat-containing protein [Hirschfeldia incana]